MIGDLQRIGFTINDARVYLALVQFGESTPADLAAHCGIDRSRVYDSLKRLANYNYVRQESTKSRPRYFAEDPAQVFADIQEDFREKLKVAENIIQPLQDRFQKPELLHDSFWNIEGASKIQNSIKSIIKNAKTRLSLIITPDLLTSPDQQWILRAVLRKFPKFEGVHPIVQITLPISSMETPEAMLPDLIELAKLGTTIFNFSSHMMPFGLYLNDQSFLFVLASQFTPEPVYESGIWIENATEDKLQGFSHLADWMMRLTKQSELWTPPQGPG